MTSRAILAARALLAVGLLLTPAVLTAPASAARAPVPAECTRATTISLVRRPYRSPSEVLAGLVCLETHLVTRGDRRAIFASIYATTTSHISAALERGDFHDQRWTANYLVAFGNLYREAFWRYEAGKVEAVPAAWRVAFEWARRGRNAILQDAALGINAHVNHDLAFALLEAGLGRDRPQRHDDHTRINAILVAATADVQQSLARTYSAALQDIADLDEALAGAIWYQARERAWQNALRLHAAAPGSAREAVSTRLEMRAGHRGRRVVRFNRSHPEALSRLLVIEGSQPGSEFCARFPCRPWE